MIIIYIIENLIKEKQLLINNMKLDGSKHYNH